MTSACWPDAIADHAPSWAGVGSANDDVNHSRVDGEKVSSGREAGTSPFSPRPPTGRPLRFCAGACDDGIDPNRSVLAVHRDSRDEDLLPQVRRDDEDPLGRGAWL